MGKVLEHALMELNEEDCVKLLQKKNFCHMGCYDGKSPYVVPMNYLYESGAIYCHSRPGKKLEILEDHPLACIQVEEVTDFIHWKSVMVWGKFHEIVGEESARIFRQMIQTYQRHPLAPLELELSTYLDRATVYRFAIDRMSGRSENWGHA